LQVGAVSGAEGGVLSLALEEATLEIDPALGARVIGLCLAGRNLLTGPEVDPLNFGSTFWTAPQSHWGWPPIPEIDSAPYAVSFEGEALSEGHAIVLRGPTCQGLGVSIEKRFSISRVGGTFVIDYRVVNRGAVPVDVAPWEVTRVLPNGLTFFATGAGTYAPSDLPAREVGGITWLRHDAAVIAGHQKLYADAGEGWIAHVDADVLFLKTFALVPRAAHAPGEAQIEIYASSHHRYVEVEQQGACATIGVGGSLDWRVEWRLRRLPARLPVDVGSADLVRHVRELVAGSAK
jgi:hypothetical protein